jgi:hypothetical protein
MKLTESLNIKNINIIENNYITVTGYSSKPYYWIAAKKPDRLFSYSGSLLPFPNEDTAFGHMSPKGKVLGNFTLTFPYPNAFYSKCTNFLNKPQIRFTEDGNKDYILVVGEQQVNNRSLMEYKNSPNHPITTYGGYGSGGICR